MKVIVDSDVWSEAFRRRRSDWGQEVGALFRLIEDESVLMIGAIRQEVLSGLRDGRTYGRIRGALRAFVDETVPAGIYEAAAANFNACRRHGIQGSHTDFLICACAAAWNAAILSKDRDYEHYRRVIPVSLYRPRPG